MPGAELWLLCNLAMSIDTFEAARELVQDRADEGPPRVNDKAHAAASESASLNDDDDNESQEADAEFADFDDDVEYHGKAEDTEAVNTTLYHTTPAPPNRSDMTREKSTSAWNDDKEQTPEVTKG